MSPLIYLVYLHINGTQILCNIMKRIAHILRLLAYTRERISRKTACFVGSLNFLNDCIYRGRYSS